MQTTNRLLIWLVLLLVSACSSNESFNEYQAIEGYSWKKDAPVIFNVISTDTISKKNVFINIRNNKEYRFSSIFLIGKIKFPSGIQVIDTLEYEMADANGKWLGTGFSDLKENKLFYKEAVQFLEAGSYEFSIEQATRGINDIYGTEPLEGITDVGLSIENSK